MKNYNYIFYAFLILIFGAIALAAIDTRPKYENKVECIKALNLKCNDNCEMNKFLKELNYCKSNYPA